MTPTMAQICFAILIALCCIAHRINCGNFNLVNDPQQIPNEWLQKLDGLKLQDLMDQSLRSAKRNFEMDQQLEQYVLDTGIHVTNGSSSFSLLLDNLPSNLSKESDKVAQFMLKLSSQFVYSECITKGIPHKHCATYISRLIIPVNSQIHQQCSEINSRSKDALGHPYRRLLPADYSDGLSKIRRTKHGHQLPNPRNISSLFYEAAMEKVNDVVESSEYSPEGKLDRSRSVFFAQWSQFVEQNLVQTAQHTHDNGKPVECCKGNHVAPPRSSSSSCSPVKVSEKDTHYKQFFVRCLNYVRSALTVDPNCKLGAINQLNLASDHLDLSQVYGTTEESHHKLRLNRDGKLKTDSNDFLPPTLSNCLTAKDGTCLRSGDSRVNVNPYMIVQHSIFHKSHNQIAGQLKELNPQWTDEELFNAARRINAAIYQKITYEEWLPMLIGHRQGIQLRTSSNEELTSGEQDRGVSNEFATAIRFYNSMLPGDLFEEPQKKLFELRETFYKPNTLNWTQVMRTKIVTSMLKQRAMALDTSYVDDLNVDLYRAKNGDGRESVSFGMDSLALDIMRSRDHGLSGYVQYLNACRGQRSHRRRADHEASVVSTWEQLASQFSAKDLELLRKIYHHVEDIDLIVGGIAERSIDDSLVKPTFSCIIGEQFHKSLHTDPNFYTKDHRLRQTVQTYSAAKLLCDTMQLESVQADVFQVPSLHGRNPIVCCAELSNGLDLEPWRNGA